MNPINSERMPSPTRWMLWWARAFAILLTVFGLWATVTLISTWRWASTLPVGWTLGQNGALGEIMLVSVAFVIFGFGMLWRQRWAWLGAVLSVSFAFTLWMIVGIRWLVNDYRESSTTTFLTTAAPGIVLPAILFALLVPGFLLTPDMRACFNAGALRVRRPLLYTMAAAVAIFILLFFLGDHALNVDSSITLSLEGDGTAGVTMQA